MQELRECTFWPDTSRRSPAKPCIFDDFSSFFMVFQVFVRSTNSFRASRTGSMTRSTGLVASRDGSRSRRAPSAGSRSSSLGQSPRDDRMADGA